MGKEELGGERNMTKGKNGMVKTHINYFFSFPQINRVKNFKLKE